MNINKTIQFFLVGTILVLSAFLTAIQTAQNKPFWVDEGYDIGAVWEAPVADIVLGRLDQPNNNPLYYVFQKINFSLTRNIDEGIAVRFRIVSIFSACLIVFLIYFYVFEYFGLYWAAFTVLTLLNYNIFFEFAAESRPYSLWLLCLTMLALAAIRLMNKPYHQIKSDEEIFLLVSGIAISLVISFGPLQVFFAVCACLFAWIFYYPDSSKKKMIVQFAIPIIAICAGVELFYVLNKAAFFRQFDAMQFDLLAEMKKGNYGLLKMPLRLLFPKAGRDTSLFGPVENLAVVVGLVIPALTWRQRKCDKTKLLANVSVSAIAQVMAMIALVGIVVFLRYYFVQRMFLCLIICHSLLAFTGTFFIVETLKAEHYKKIVKGLLMILMIGLTLQHHQPRFFYEAVVANDKCEVVKLPLAGGYQLIGDLKEEFSSKRAHFQKLNNAVRLSKNLRKCGVKDVPLYLWYNEADQWFLSQDIPQAGKPFTFANSKDLETNWSLVKPFR